MDQHIKIDKAMKKAKASIELEGATITPAMDKLVRRNMLGEINDEQFLEEVLKMINREE